MKKLTIALFLTAGALSLLGCNNPYQMKEQPLQPMQQSYQGVLPCADCSGLETALFLDKDGTFVLQETYLGNKNGDRAFASYGKWTRTAGKLVLTDSKSRKRYFRPQGQALQMLDQSGVPIESGFNYILSPIAKALPKTPMTMSGFYTYLADAATYKDCVTGKSFPVANNIALEQGYAKARKEPGEPVFLMLSGHFSVQPSMEAGQIEKTVVADGQITFGSDQHCATQ